MELCIELIFLSLQIFSYIRIQHNKFKVNIPTWKGYPFLLYIVPLFNIYLIIKLLSQCIHLLCKSNMLVTYFCIFINSIMSYIRKSKKASFLQNPRCELITQLFITQRFIPIVLITAYIQ